jgi:uncharacterized membrane-anchored protein
VIDMLDLDRTSAEALASRRPAAVLNVQSSISGRYPAGGPSVLEAAGIPLLDGVDSAILTVREGTIATVDLFAQGREPQGEDGAQSVDSTEPAPRPEKGKAKGTAKGEGSAAVPVASEADDARGSRASEPAKGDAPKGDEDDLNAETEAPAVTASNALGRWWLERNQQRIARKRASLTWLDELRESEGATADDNREPTELGERSERTVASGERTRIDAVATAREPGTWRASVDVGGLELSGRVMDAVAIDAALAEAESGMATQLAVFTANAMDVLDRSGGALLEGEGLPELGVDVKGKHVVVVAAGYGAQDALQSIKPFLRDHKPVVIAVSDGAEVARKARIQPAVIIGATAGVSDSSLKAAKSVIIHGAAGSVADAGEAKLGAIGREHASSDLAVASEDLAILLARAGGARSIVTVGIEATLLDFLESGRVDSAGTFLARLSAGPRLVDARALASVYRNRWSGVVIIAAIVLAVVALLAALWANGDSREWLREALTATGLTS